MPFKHCLLGISKQLQVLSQFTYTYENSVAGHNSEYMPSLTTIYYSCYLNQGLTFISTNAVSHWICLLRNNKKESKVLLLIQIIGLTKYFLLLIFIISNFLLVLELLTISIVIFLFISLASIAMTSSYLTLINSTIQQLCPPKISLILLLLLIPVLKITWPPLSCIFISTTDQLSKLYTMW